MSKRIRVAIVGATGYTGAELLRLTHGHPRIEVTAIVGQSKAGQRIAQILPNQAGVRDGDIESADMDAIAGNADAAFCALPHGASAPIVSALRSRGVPVFDLSADFRLRDLDTYGQWYGEHGAPELLPDAVYGLPELYREQLKTTDLVAVPGCYPTAATLALIPLVKEGCLDLSTIVIDAKSGASGAGRALSEATHFSQLAEGVRAYKVGGNHRHGPEMEQTLSAVAGEPVRLTFTPHLLPMIRGILATAYATVKQGDAERFTQLAREFYADSPSVHVLDPGQNPDTLAVRGSNRAFVSYAVDGRVSRLVAQCAIDNLVKGASGAALQCFNVRFGLEEDEGLRGLGMYP